MFRRVAFHVLLSGLLFSWPVLSQDMPTELYVTRMPEYPLWLAASEVFRDGELQEGRMHPEFADSIRRILTDGQLLDRETGCIRVEESGDLVEGRHSLLEVVGSSKKIFSGTVTGLADGFRGWSPGTLVEVSDISSLKGEASSHVRRYAFFGIGDFMVGPHRLCKVDENYPALPSIGDRLVVFQPEVAFVSDDEFIEIHHGSSFAVIEATSGKGRVGWPLSETVSQQDLADLAGSIAGALEEVVP